MFDSIFALATSNSKSALHLHRLSGKNTFDFLFPYLLNPSTKKPIHKESIIKDLTTKSPISRYLLLVNEQGDLIDDVICTFFSEPKSFTGENIIELSLHGSPLLSLKLHSFLRSIGFRDAKAGEFTQRAVLHGKLDLSQAEGIHQLIQAESMGAIELARNNINGLLSKESLELRHVLITILAYLEAHIDFAPDEVGEYDPSSLIDQILLIENRLQSLFESYSTGLKLREGLRIVLAGKPNAGKSSLYNALLKEDRAIVTNIPGTTRDILEDRLVIDHCDFVLLDTAGLHDTQDIVEKLGVERSIKSILNADIISYIVDISLCTNTKELFSYLNKELDYFFDLFKNKNIDFKSKKIILIASKSDLISQENLNTFLQFQHPLIYTKSITSQNSLSYLHNTFIDIYNKFKETCYIKETPAIISTRQKDKVNKALFAMKEAHALILIKDFPEKIASVINQARFYLEEIVGEVELNCVYEKIFSTFCIGK